MASIETSQHIGRLNGFIKFENEHGVTIIGSNKQPCGNPYTAEKVNVLVFRPGKPKDSNITLYVMSAIGYKPTQEEVDNKLFMNVTPDKLVCIMCFVAGIVDSFMLSY